MTSESDLVRRRLVASNLTLSSCLINTSVFTDLYEPLAIHSMAQCAIWGNNFSVYPLRSMLVCTADMAYPCGFLYAAVTKQTQTIYGDLRPNCIFYYSSIETTSLTGDREKIYTVCIMSISMLWFRSTNFLLSSPSVRKPRPTPGSPHRSRCAQLSTPQIAVRSTADGLCKGEKRPITTAQCN